MNLDLTILRLASGLASHATARQQVIAENIAHADSPGYRARDIADFAETLDATSGAMPAFAARTTRPGHIAFGAGRQGDRPDEVPAFGAETPNGNTVSLEDQMMRATEVRQSYDMALGVYSKSLAILRSALGRGS
jgi:flagellar basal-body rod protein FlgB